MKELFFSLLGSFMAISGIILLISGLEIAFWSDENKQISFERLLIVLGCLAFVCYLIYKILK